VLGWGGIDMDFMVSFGLPAFEPFYSEFERVEEWSMTIYYLKRGFVEIYASTVMIHVSRARQMGVNKIKEWF